MIMIISEE